MKSRLITGMVAGTLLAIVPLVQVQAASPSEKQTRDAASGLPTGKRQHKPMSLKKRPVRRRVIILSRVRHSRWRAKTRRYSRLVRGIRIRKRNRRLVAGISRNIRYARNLMSRIVRLQRDPRRNRVALKRLSIRLKKQARIISRSRLRLKRAWASKLRTSGADAHLRNVDMQNQLQKMQQTLTMLSNISKVLHDVSMAISRKIG